jgi:hypothetical protein
VCINIFSDNQKFMKLYNNPSLDISFCSSHGFQCHVYLHTIMNMCDLYMSFLEQKKINENE